MSYICNLVQIYANFVNCFIIKKGISPKAVERFYSNNNLRIQQQW